LENSILFRLIIAILTFSIGVAVTVITDLPLALLLSLSLLFLIPLIIIGIVLYQGAYLKKEWRPAIGKGFLAIFLWLYPSIVVVLVNLFSWMNGFQARSLTRKTLLGKLIISSFTVVYALSGFALCWWVKRYSVGKHWLLNNQRA
jgi:hypothetical protein